MDEMERILADGDRLAAARARKDSLLTEMHRRMVLATNGGVFVADLDLIARVTGLINSGVNSAPLLDRNSNPVMIDDLADFRSRALAKYTSAVNGYSMGMAKLRNGA